MRSRVTCSRKSALAQVLIVGAELLLRGRIVGGKLGSQLVLDLLDERVALGLAVSLGVESILQAVADLGLELAVVGFVELGSGKCPLGLAGLGNQLIDCGNDLLDLFVGELDGGKDDFFSLFLGARLDHHDAVFVSDDHDVDGCGSALGIGGIDDELAIDAANADGANSRAERNVGKSQRSRGCVDSDHVGIVFLVGGEDQRDHLGLVAEAIRKEWTNGAIDLAAGKNFLLAGPAFALDESSGNASTGVGVFAIIDGEGKEIDSLSGIGRSDRGSQNNGFAGGDECGTGGLLGHAAGLKDQPLAAGKLDCYFMLGRHSVLFSFFRLGNLVWEDAEGRWGVHCNRIEERRRRTNTQSPRGIDPLRPSH